MVQAKYKFPTFKNCLYVLSQRQKIIMSLYLNQTTCNTTSIIPSLRYQSLHSAPPKLETTRVNRPSDHRPPKSRYLSHMNTGHHTCRYFVLIRERRSFWLWNNSKFFPPHSLIALFALVNKVFDIACLHGGFQLIQLNRLFTHTEIGSLATMVLFMFTCPIAAILVDANKTMPIIAL